MPYVYRDIVRGAPKNPLEFPSLTEDVLREQFAQSFEENPVKAAFRWNELREDHKTGPLLPAETARQRLKDAGFENDLKVSDAGITEAALETLMFRKGVEKKRQEIFSRAEGGIGQGAARLGISFATTLMDPIGVGVNYVPIVGQVRYARWLAASRSVLGRVGVRAGVGAAEGAVGATLVEPLIYGMRSQEQADYDTADSLLNVAFGGVVGSGLHVGVGTAGELVRGALVGRRIPRAPDLPATDRVVETRLAKRIASSVDAAIKEYASVPGSDGGRVLNTDLARELSPEYRADRTRSAAVHEPASYLVKQMYARKLAEKPGPSQDPLVVFSAGGTGAGKTTGLDLASKTDPDIARAQIIYDTNMNGLKSSIQKIEQALAAGKQVSILYTWRDPVDSLVHGALPRAKRMGRTVPLKDHAETHVGAAKTVKALAEHYKDDERVGFLVIDNSHGKNRARVGQLADIRDLDYNRVREDLNQALEALYAAGEVPDAIYRGTAGRNPPGPNAANGPGRSRRSEPGEAVTAAERVAAATPTVQQAALRAAVGQAVQGRPINVDPIFAAAEGDTPTVPLDPVDADYRNASAQAETQLKKAPEDTPEGTLKAAEEEASLAEAEAKALADRLGINMADDADIAAITEAAVKAERWARAAELATVCLVRGG